MKLIMSVHDIGSRAMGVFERGILRYSAQPCGFRVNVLMQERRTVCVISPYCWLRTPNIEAPSVI